MAHLSFAFAKPKMRHTHTQGGFVMERVTPRTGERESLRVHIRWMIRRDMPEVLCIEESSFDYAWTDEDFLRCLRQRQCIGMVAEHGEKVLGFFIKELHRSKFHILNFAVHPDFRHQGIGSQMAGKLISQLASEGHPNRRTIELEVREKNLPAQLFFRSQGFEATRVLRSYYEDTGEDAFLMRYQLNGAHMETETSRLAQYFEGQD